MARVTLGSSAATRTAESLLQDRLLLQTSSRWSNSALNIASSPMGGLVLTGNTAASSLRSLAHSWPQMLLAYDPEAYRTFNATADAPFALPHEGLFGLTDLPQVLDEQRSMGCAIALTPTGHLEVGDIAALRATMVATERLNRADTLVRLPLDARWLGPSLIGEVLGSLKNSMHPVALSLAHARDPLSIAGVAESLQRIARVDTPVLLMRTDLAGLDFLARGGMASTVGTTSTLRHGTAPHLQGRKINVADQRSNLLWGPLLRYIRPSRLEDLFANAPLPSCDCGRCCGAPLDRFDRSAAGQSEARLHNLTVFREIFEVFRLEQVDRRRATWCSAVRSAIAEHERLAISLGQRTFRPPEPLTQWAF